MVSQGNRGTNSASKSKIVVTVELGGRRTGSHCLMGVEFMFGKMKTFQRWMVVKDSLNVLHATELDA